MNSISFRVCPLLFSLYLHHDHYFQQSILTHPLNISIKVSLLSLGDSSLSLSLHLLVLPLIEKSNFLLTWNPLQPSYFCPSFGSLWYYWHQYITFAYSGNFWLHIKLLLRYTTLPYFVNVDNFSISWNLATQDLWSLYTVSAPIQLNNPCHGFIALKNYYINFFR